MPDTNEAPDLWPPWQPRDVRSLAAFVSAETIVNDDRLRLTGSVLGRYPQDGPADDARHAIAREQYERLLRLEVPYDYEPFTSRREQLVRDPQLVLDETGTCLDMSLLYASMCLAGWVTPLVVLTELDHGGHHAFVALDLRRDLSRGPTAGSPPVDQTATEHGVYRFADDRRELEELLSAGSIVAVDPTRASTGYGASWDEACEEGRSLLLGGRWVSVIDVVAIHVARRSPVPPMRPPRFRRAIRRYAPEVDTGFVDYPSRRRVLHDLRSGGTTGRLALVGAQGLGKSRLAREVVGGIGWFLNASSKENLIRELATAELRELGQPAGDLETPDAALYAENARLRLEQAATPWRVVFDNANRVPGEILALLPTPDPAKEQTVIVTSTNPKWADVTDFKPVALEPLDGEELPAGLGDESELVRLIAGRALLVTASMRLLDATGWAPAELVARIAPDEGPGDAELEGPSGLWGAVAQAEGFGDDDREVAHLLAWLPADDLTADLVEVVHPDGVVIARRLARWGVLDELEDGRLFTMHRLFGTILRDEQEGQAADERVIGLLQVEAVVDALGEGGERESIDRLVDRVVAVDEAGDGGRRLGRALAAVGGVVELQGGVSASSDLYRRALAWLDANDADDRPLLATCLHGRARAVNQHPGGEAAVVAAIEGIVRSIELRTEEDDVVGAARGRAMQALLVQKRAGYTRVPEEKLRIFVEAMEIIDRSYEERRGVASPLEVARAQFNKGGVRVNLAQRDDPARARSYLQEAEKAYKSVLENRRSLYARKVHPHIAACLSGLAIVDYYRAILLTGEDRQRRVDWLRTATTYATSALGDWQVLDGTADRREVAKIGALLGKIALARQSFAVSRSVESFEEVRKGIDQLLGEIERAGIFPPGEVVPPPADE